jgi:hypothetical protein
MMRSVLFLAVLFSAYGNDVLDSISREEFGSLDHIICIVSVSSQVPKITHLRSFCF